MQLARNPNVSFFHQTTSPEKLATTSARLISVKNIKSDWVWQDGRVRLQTWNLNHPSSLVKGCLNQLHLLPQPPKEKHCTGEGMSQARHCVCVTCAVHWFWPTAQSVATRQQSQTWFCKTCGHLASTSPKVVTANSCDKLTLLILIIHCLEKLTWILWIRTVLRDVGIIILFVWYDQTLKCKLSGPVAFQAQAVNLMPGPFDNIAMHYAEFCNVVHIWYKLVVRVLWCTMDFV